MKKEKIIFWVTTGLVALMMSFSAFGYFTNPEMKASFIHLGFPAYFRIELGVAKLLGAIALLVPFTPKFLRQFAYSGFAITFISASIAHVSCGDPVAMAMAPLVFLGLLAVSYIYAQKLEA